MDDQPGLRLKATTEGRAWIYRYKSPIDGKMRQVKIGAWPAMSAAKAVVDWERLRDLRESGRDPAGEKRTARVEEKAAVEERRQALLQSGYTVRILCEDFLVGHVERNRAAKGAKETRRLFDKMLGELANMPAADVTRAQAFNLLESFLSTPVLASSLRRELGSAWDYALDAGRIPESTPNWWRLVMRGRLKSKGKVVGGQNVGMAKRHLSAAELSALIPWWPNFSRTVEDALTLYLWTGTRGAEILSMERAEITEEADGIWWTIPKHKTKNARFATATDLRVPLVGRALATVQRRMQQENHGYLFPSPRNPGVPIEQKAIGISVWFYRPDCPNKRNAERSRMPVSDWTPHDLRRTARTMLASLGCPDSVAEAVLGHMPTGIQAVYNRHSYDSERREWLMKLDRHLESLLQG
jgi:integrase